MSIRSVLAATTALISAAFWFADASAQRAPVETSVPVSQGGRRPSDARHLAEPDYDLLPKLRSLHVPTLVITGDHDFIPVEIAEHIAHAIPQAEFVTLRGCGHFTYLECGTQVRERLDAFFRTAPAHP